MVFDKDSKHEHHHHETANVGAVQQTTVTTTTQAVPNTLQKEAIVTNVMEKPVLQNVIEKKNVEVHHKPVVQEVHQQKIIEIEKQPVVQQVQQQAVHQQSRVAPVYEEIGSRELGEEERLRLAKLNMQHQPHVQNQQTVQQFREGETVAQVIKQENIERHVQPVITEVREQTVVQEVVHPVVRKVHEPTIVREVTYAADSGRFQTFNAKFVPSNTQAHTEFAQQNAQQSNLLRTITLNGKRNMYSLSFAGELYRLIGKEGAQSWEHVPTAGLLFRDISCGRGGALFGIGAKDGFLYKLGHSDKPELVMPNDTTRLSQLSVATKRKIYALAEDGSVLYTALPRFGHNASWERLGGKLKKISVGGGLLRRTELWGIGADNRPYRWFDNQWIPYQAELQDISVASDNSVYGVSMDGRLLKWNGSDLFGLQDQELRGENAHYLANARLTGVAAYKETKHVYAIEKGSSNVLKMLF
jgi:hypothetical protein